MNSLEYIDKQILFVKQNIQYHKELLATTEDDESIEIIKSTIKLLEPDLQTLQQIKAELEAWYVLKPDLEHTENKLGEHEIELRVFYTDADVELHDTKEKYYKLKKALEVEDER